MPALTKAGEGRVMITPDRGMQMKYSCTLNCKELLTAILKKIIVFLVLGVAASKSLSLKQLTLKTTALLLLLFSHRGQTIMNFKIGPKIELWNSLVCFHIDDLKTLSRTPHKPH